MRLRADWPMSSDLLACARPRNRFVHSGGGALVGRRASMVARACLLVAVLGSGCVREGRLSASLQRFPADGRSGGQVILHRPMFAGIIPYMDVGLLGPEPVGDPIASGSRMPALAPGQRTASSAGALIRILGRVSERTRDVVYFRSGGRSGAVRFRSTSGQVIRLEFYPPKADMDEDGFPDAAELVSEADRQAFRSWFVRIAESQYLKSNVSWNRRERDCSGLIRYSYREALKKHDEHWQVRHGIVVDKNLPDVTRFNYPGVPEIGRKLWRIRKQRAGGPHAEDFGTFADARTLMRWNTVLVGRDVREAEPGDLLFFDNPSNHRFPRHSMIVAGRENDIVTLIYHTGGPEGMKRVPVSHLDKSGVFRPAPWNRSFLGVYRFHILN